MSVLIGLVLLAATSAGNGGNAVIDNQAFKLAVSVSDNRVLARLEDHGANQVLCDGPIMYRLVLPATQGTINYDRLTKAHVEANGDTLSITGDLAGLEIRHTFRLPADKSYMEENLEVANNGAETVSPTDMEIGLQRRIASPEFRVASELGSDRVVAIPFRKRATDPSDFYHDYSLDELFSKYGQVQRAVGPFGQGDLPSRHRASEGWAWLHGERALGIFAFNQEAIQFSAISTEIENDGVFLRIGGVALVDGQPQSLLHIAPKQRIGLGVTRFQSIAGGYNETAYAFRSFLDEHGCRFPANYNAPVHWNEIYDNPEWTLTTPGHPKEPRMTRPYTYTRALIEKEAQKAHDYSCEALYLDPGWDTDFGTFQWGKQWLGSCKSFVHDVHSKYGLQLSLHCPLATWMSVDRRGVPTWPHESFRMDTDGHVVENSVCLGSKQYLDEAERRLDALCADGVTFLMFDGNCWNGGCVNPTHGHPVPYTVEDHCRANLDLAQRIHKRFPNVIIEMHDMVAGGSPIRYTPVYYKYGLPGSYNDNWGLELMWDSMADVQSGRAKSLFYYNLACNVPAYLHVDLRDDNVDCLTLWWFASTCRHLGIGGTHNNPVVADAQKRAMQRYHELERFYKRGEFYGMKQVGLTEAGQPEEIHLHVLKDEGALVANLFNLSDKKRRITGGVPVSELGLDPNAWYATPKGSGFNSGSGWFHVDREMEPWSTYVVEVRRADTVK